MRLKPTAQSHAWRLPSANELLSITDLGSSDPTIDPTFRNVVSDFYWSSTTVAGDASDALGVNFYYGGDDVWTTKIDIYYVRYVRDN
ncbi:MAG: DUF1566 domain-containing protein [Epsilonproteobacteria bacterium]|nr:DUF1566 domain-containing protein [Campylobacterota bacterium]